MVRVIMVVVGLCAAAGTAWMNFQGSDSGNPDADPTDRSVNSDESSSDTTGDDALTGAQTDLFERYSDLLFLIGKSANANIVLYRGAAGKDQWQTPEVQSEWLMLADKGQTEAVTTLEQQAFGFTIEAGADSAVRILTLSAVPDRKMTLTFSEDLERPIATTQVNGQDVRLVRIFVQATENFLGMPTVEYIDLFGYDADQNVVTERLKND